MKYFLSFLIFICICELTAQENLFRLFGGDKNDVGNTIIKKTDGAGYLIGGSTRSFGNGSSDYFILDLDNNLEVNFQQTYGSPYFEDIKSILIFKNNYYLFGNSSITSQNGDLDFNTTIVNPLGEVLEIHTIRKTFIDVAYKAVKTSDNNYLTIGLSRSSQLDNIHGQSKLYKMSPEGNVLLEKDYGERSIRDYGFDIIETQLGYLILSNLHCEVGLMARFPMMKEPSSVSLLQTDFNGDTIWEYIYPGQDFDYAYSMVQLKRHIYVAMNTRSGNSKSFDVKVLKIDLQGHLVDSFSFGGNDFEYANKIIADSKGDLLICGTTASYSERPSFYAVKFDTLGLTKWEKVVSGNASIYANDVFEKNNSNYLFTGNYIFNPDNSDIFVLELNEDGKVVPPQDGIYDKEALEIYPNPTYRRSILKLSKKKIKSIEIFNLNSKMVFQKEYLGDSKSVVINFEQFKSGVYIVSISDVEGNTINGKISVL